MPIRDSAPALRQLIFQFSAVQFGGWGWRVVRPRGGMYIRVLNHVRELSAGMERTGNYRIWSGRSGLHPSLSGWQGILTSKHSRGRFIL